MFYVDCDLEYWTKKHKIDVIDYTCSSCGVTQKTTIPVITYQSLHPLKKI